MVIKFLCPEGHRVHSPDEQAGRAAKCPHCDSKFRVPTPPVPDSYQAERLDSVISSPSMTSAAAVGSSVFGSASSANLPAAPGSASGSVVGRKEPQITFLCPNGHRLHGPASLQGRPGQCPECGSKFRIPVYEHAEDEDETLGPGQAEEAPSEEEGYEEQQEGEQAEAEEEEQEEEVDEEEDTEEPEGEEEQQYSEFDFDLEEEGGEHGDEGSIGLSGAAPPSLPILQPPHGLATACQKLWSLKPAGATVEIAFSDGKTISANRFAWSLSKRQCGVFAEKQEDGTFVVVAVPWESVAAVIVHGAKELPTDLFPNDEPPPEQAPSGEEGEKKDQKPQNGK